MINVPFSTAQRRFPSTVRSSGTSSGIVDSTSVGAVASTVGAVVSSTNSVGGTVTSVGAAVSSGTVSCVGTTSASVGAAVEAVVSSGTGTDSLGISITFVGSAISSAKAATGVLPTSSVRIRIQAIIRFVRFAPITTSPVLLQVYTLMNIIAYCQDIARKIMVSQCKGSVCIFHPSPSFVANRGLTKIVRCEI